MKNSFDIQKTEKFSSLILKWMIKQYKERKVTIIIIMTLFIVFHR